MKIEKPNTNTDAMFRFTFQTNSYNTDAYPIIEFELPGVDEHFNFDFWLVGGFDGDGPIVPGRVAFARRLALLIQQGAFNDFTQEELDVTSLKDWGVPADRQGNE